MTEKQQLAEILTAGHEAFQYAKTLITSPEDRERIENTMEALRGGHRDH